MSYFFRLSKWGSHPNYQKLFSSRKYEGLRKKFNDWSREKVPTGDPDIPDEVSKAISIQAEIKEKAQLVVAGLINDSDEEDCLDTKKNYTDKATEDGGDDTDVDNDSIGTNGTNTTTAATATAKEKKPVRPRNHTPRGDDLIIERMKVAEKNRRKREKAREKRRDRKDKRNMKLLIGLATAAVSAFAGKKTAKKAKKAVDVAIQSSSSSSSSSSDSNDSESESESLSSVNTDDSPPTKRAKLSQQQKKVDTSKKVI